MTFSVTILGSSSALPTATRFPAAHAVNSHGRLFLVDCAEGTQMQLRRYRQRMKRIDHVFLSHLHGDHVLGVFGLISTLNLLGRTAPLSLYAHPNFEEILHANVRFFNDRLMFPLHFHPLNCNTVETVYEDRHLTVSTLPLRHSVPSVGFLFREKLPPPNLHKHLVEKHSIGLADIARIKAGGDFVTAGGETIPHSALTFQRHPPRSYAYCSDTLYSERLVGLLKGVDLLYHEATFLSKDMDLARQTGHSTAAQAATVAQKANAGMLLIGHFSSRYKNALQHEAEARAVFPNTVAVEDGQVYEIARKQFSG